jgi:purine-binding chemotaxis protein CheW
MNAANFASPASRLVRSYLTFCIQNNLYGIDTLAVEEIFLLPELTPIPEAPRDLVGVFNLRGDILPAIDLQLRFGLHSLDYALTDSIIVIKSNQNRVGLIVNQVLDVRNISIHEITSELTYKRETIELETVGIQAGIARSNDEIAILLNPDSIIRFAGDRQVENLASTQPETAAEFPDLPAVESRNLVSSMRAFCPQATPEERAIFQQRAHHLMQLVETEERQGLQSLAVIGLGTELFGIDLAVVREFTNVSKVTPIPCCPPYIVGNMNLRGEIVTLVDIRHVLNLARLEAFNFSKATIVEVDNIVAGIVVEQVYDIILLQPTDISSVPTAIHAIDDEYLLGTVRYQDKMLALLDIAKILLKGELAVDEV